MSKQKEGTTKIISMRTIVNLEIVNDDLKSIDCANLSRMMVERLIASIDKVISQRNRIIRETNANPFYYPDDEEKIVT